MNKLHVSLCALAAIVAFSLLSSRNGTDKSSQGRSTIPSEPAKVRWVPATDYQPAATTPTPREQEITDMVYITRTGKRFHSAGCRHLSQSMIPIERDKAIENGYTPCKVCRP